MISPIKFEIKVALLGFVSVGKTTVLNAIFRDKFGEVAMRRTTAGVNYFRVSTKSKNKTDEAGIEQEDSKSDPSPASSIDKATEWSAEADEARTAESTHEEIKADNAELRDSTVVHEKFFDIELDDDLCEMRKDTRLVIVDIPGVNEAGVGTKYMDYAEEKWDTFDCVVVVMDGRQGVNTEEQVDLLKFVKKQTEEKKEVPVIILCNKVDEPDDEELSVQVDEARSEIERIFQVSDRSQALEKIVNASSKNKARVGPSASRDLYPIFISTSAIHAFIYQTASRMTLDQFKRFDKDLIEKLGREEVGKWQWKKMSQKDKYKTAHDAVSDPLRFQERLEATNFDKFLSVLSYSIGGDEVQLALIGKQLDVELQTLSSGKYIAAQIRSIYKKSTVLGKSDSSNLEAKFWAIYQKSEDAVFQDFDRPDKVERVSSLLDELEAYLGLALEVGWTRQEPRIVGKIKTLFRRQIATLNNHVSTSAGIYTHWNVQPKNLGRFVFPPLGTQRSTQSLGTVGKTQSDTVDEHSSGAQDEINAFSVGMKTTRSSFGQRVTPTKPSFSFQVTPTKGSTPTKPLFSFPGMLTKGSTNAEAVATQPESAESAMGIGQQANTTSQKITKPEAIAEQPENAGFSANKRPFSSSGQATQSPFGPEPDPISTQPKNEPENVGSLTWATISPEDCNTIVRSILLVSSDRNFCMIFGQEKLLLEGLLDCLSTNCSSSTNCSLCHKQDGDKGDLVSFASIRSLRQLHTPNVRVNKDGLLELDFSDKKNLESYEKVHRVKVPESWEDPTHWGHIAWRVCNIVTKRDDS